jgi:hypothetical protein
MKGTVTINRVDDCSIEVLGVRYYDEEYVSEMMRREHQRGLREGQQVHVAQFKPIQQEEISFFSRYKED